MEELMHVKRKHEPRKTKRYQQKNITTLDPIDKVGKEPLRRLVRQQVKDMSKVVGQKIKLVPYVRLYNRVM